MNTIKEIAPTAIIVHDKFHLFKKLSEAIDKTSRKEVKDNPQFKKQRYTVLKMQKTEQKHSKNPLTGSLKII